MTLRCREVMTETRGTHVLTHFINTGRRCHCLRTPSKSRSRGVVVNTFLHSPIGKAGLHPQPPWQRLPWVCKMQIKGMIAITLSASPLGNPLKQWLTRPLPLTARGTVGLQHFQQPACVVYNYLRFENALLNEIQSQAEKILNSFLVCSWLHFYGNVDQYPNQNFFNNEIKSMSILTFCI